MPFFIGATVNTQIHHDECHDKFIEFCSVAGPAHWSTGVIYGIIPFFCMKDGAVDRTGAECRSPSEVTRAQDK